MNIKLFRYLSFFMLLPAYMNAEDTTPPESRSLMNAFEPQKAPTAQPVPKTSTNTSSSQSSIIFTSLPTPPPVDTKALNAPTPSLTQEEEKEDPFATPAHSSFPATPKVQKTQPSTVKSGATTSAPVTKKLSAKETKEEKAKKAKALKEEQEKDQLVRFYFEDATLENLVRYIEELYNIKFLIDDDFTPPPSNGAILKGNKITFKTNKPLTREEAWDLFLKFLDVAGLSVVETQVKGFYRITTITNANTEALPTFFNTKVDALPDNNLKVRYVFFVKNSPLSTIQVVVSQLASPSAKVDTFPDLNAIIVTDKSVNIRSLMKIVQEFDKEMPEAMSVLKLRKADAQDVATLYQDLTKTENPQGIARFLGQRAQPDSIYFPANARIIVEPRTNSLILLGPTKALAKIEDFISKYIDVDLNMPYSPLYIYEVQYLNATALASILTNVINFGQGNTAATYGGVRDGNEYFGPVNITPETTGNRLVIKAEERDYKKLVALIEQLDVIQPEVAIEVLIVNISGTDAKNLGAQIHNKTSGSPLNNVNFQTSGFPTSNGPSAPIINSTTGSLLGSLIGLANNGSTANGATYLTVGNATAGVWGIFQILKSYTETSIIANPFLLATNNYAAQVSVGTSRQIQTGSVISSQGPTASYDTLPANLTVQITPQISLDNSVQMSINVNLTDFSDPSNLAIGNTFTQQVVTNVSVRDRQIVVLGGIVKTSVSDVETKLPILGDIPLLGWFFKNKQKTTTESKILIFISPRILTLKQGDTARYYTLNKSEDCAHLVDQMYPDSQRRDPIYRSFFEGATNEHAEMEGFLAMDPALKDAVDELSTTKKSMSKKAKKAAGRIKAEQRKSSQRRGRYKGGTTEQPESQEDQSPPTLEQPVPEQTTLEESPATNQEKRTSSGRERFTKKRTSA